MKRENGILGGKIGFSYNTIDIEEACTVREHRLGEIIIRVRRVRRVEQLAE